MNKPNKPTSWEELEDKFAREDFEKSKSGSILFIKDKINLKNWEICLSRWEKFLTSDYWKNWQEKIQACQDNDKLDFYVGRLSALMDFIHKNTIKVNEPDIDIKTVSKLIKKEEKRLEIISKEDWKKEDKFADVGWKELSAEKMLDDRWFSGEIDNIFGRDRKGKNNKSLKPQEDEGYNSDGSKDLSSDNYESLSREELISEIKRLKAELQKVNSSQDVVNHQTNSKKLETQLHKAESILNSFETSNASPKPINFLPIIGIVGLASLFAGLIIWKRNKKR